jgi:glycosyltransferase involved in cell wall biosynthesis
VLVVTAQPPLPEGGAAGRCVAAMLRGLVSHGLPVRTLAPRQDFALPGAPPEDLDVTVVPVARRSDGGIRAWPSRVRAPVSDLLDASFAAAVRAAAERSDVVHLDQIETACLVPLLPAGVPVAVHLHYRARRDARLGVPWRPAFRRRVEFALAERAVQRREVWLVASAGEVAATLHPRGGRDITVVPLPLDVADYPLAAHDGPAVAGILGTAAWAPTADAMRRLATQVWPLVHAVDPDARLLLAGRGTEDLAMDLTGPRVTVLGPVESAGDFLASLGVLVYPPVRGSGTKVKVLEALACGVPVVTTPPGAEGLEPHDGLLVDTSPRVLAAHVARLLADPAERRERGAAARAYVCGRHAPAVATEPLVRLYRRMLSSAAAKPSHRTASA